MNLFLYVRQFMWGFIGKSLTPCCWVICKDVVAIPRIINGSRILTFFAPDVPHLRLSALLAQ